MRANERQIVGCEFVVSGRDTPTDVTPLCSPRRTIFGRYQTNNGQILILAGNGYDANDPERTTRMA